MLHGVRQRVRAVLSEDLQLIAYNLPAPVTSGPFSTVRRALLLPLLSLGSVAVEGASTLRHWLYETGLLQQTRLPVPVISIGNITWGGNGKTPMASMTARRCWKEHGTVPLVLTRGYLGGDEARMLSSALQDIPAVVGVGPNRAAVAIQMLEANPSIGVVVLDDGMQHLSLARDLEICMINALRPFGNGRIIPRGPLRERPCTALQRCDLAVLHNSSLLWDTSELRRIQESLCSSLGPDKDLLHSNMQLTACRQLAGPPAASTMGTVDNVSSCQILKGAHILCLTAIGCPKALELQLLEAGAAAVEGAERLHDHQETPAGVMHWLTRRVAQLRAAGKHVVVLLTEKDYARQRCSMTAWEPPIDAPVVVVSGEVAVSDVNVLDAYIARVLNSRRGPLA